MYFHEKKLKKEKTVLAGDRILFYETKKHPDHKKDPEWHGVKRLFASGTLTELAETIPPERQVRGEKRWLLRRMVVPDIVVPPKMGVPLAEVRRIRGKGVGRQGFEIRPKEQFDLLEEALRRRRDSLNASGPVSVVAPQAHSWQAFRPGDPMQVGVATAPLDLAAVAAAQERAQNAHIALLNSFAAMLAELGVDPEWNAHCDLAADIAGARWLFEAKSCHEGNVLGQIRHGVSQLHEYRFRYCRHEPGAELCLVLQIAPPTELGWIVEYLERDRGIRVTWPIPDGFRDFGLSAELRKGRNNRSPRGS
ncbi:MAG: hypothetical protein K8T20_14740 [Planctomycetes bacterium]|nr:hypothetical protein [Planctomycetota bacterium]